MADREPTRRPPNNLIRCQDPVALIGSWILAAADEESGAVLRIAPDGLSVWRNCGVVTGSWRADTGGMFVADIDGSSGCPFAGELTPAWLHRATSFRVDGDRRLLLDTQGKVSARLLPGGKPSAGPNVAPSEADPPVVTDDVRRAFARSDPLPPGLAAAGRESLVGRWVPADDPMGAPQAAYVELRGNGEWRGSDGCNGQGGRWVAGLEGALLATRGASTLIGCDNVEVADWLFSARRAGLDGTVLVLVDAQGKETGRLRPAR